MNIVFERPDAHRIVAKLRDGAVETEAVSWQPRQSAADLVGAIEAAATEGYGECFWPEPTGQYWWMLRRDDRRLEVAVMWSGGGAHQWQHVFRAADEIGYVRDLVETALREENLLT